VKYTLAALACLFLIAHLLFLPPELEDIDSVNFALGVRDFDVARHQPHPPGYPVYIGLAKVSTGLFGGAENPQAIVRGLAVWSAIAGAALVVLLFALFRGLGAAEPEAWWGMAIAVTSPLFWFTALRPLSDMTGLAMAVGAQVLLVAVLTNRTRAGGAGALVAGAFLAALAAGVRVQTALLTAPLLAAALILPRGGLSLRTRLLAALAGVAGVLVWAIPLVLANGGLQAYLTVLGAQAGEDFTGVVMLWTTRRPRVVLNAVTFSFLWPWGGLIIGATVLAISLIGFARLVWRQPATAVWLAVAFLPYATFHLLFHETATVRYALPLVVPLAFLASIAIHLAGRRVSTLLSVALVGIFLIVGLPAARGYGSFETPAFAALSAVRASSPEMPTPVGMHAVFRRISEWRPPAADVIRVPHGHEWLALVERWRATPSASMSFIADPRRTDLALLDPHARDLRGTYRWTIPELPYVGGLRPGTADLYLMRSPTWMLDKGWALSAEIAGVSTRDAAGPHLQPSIAWVRATAEPMLLMYGGRNPSADASTELLVAKGETILERVSVAPGTFFRLLPLSPVLTGGSGYVPVSMRTSGGPQVPIFLDQFDVQPENVEMFGYADGWQAPEYDQQTARAWRWMSERSTLWVRPLGSDVVLTISGESPMRYFDSPPAVVVSIAGREVRRLVPTADFTESIPLPAALLAANDGRVTIESNRWFVPAERGESVDRRHLALRIYGVSVAKADR
jgi:hypothetical protein